MREVVTIQAGEEANWVGAYFWALQQQQLEEADEAAAAAASVLYESTSSSSTAWEPRALLFDTPEAFNPFRAAAVEEQQYQSAASGGGGGGASDARAAALTWKGGVDVHIQQQQQPPTEAPQPAAPRAWAEAWQGLRSWPQLERHCVGHTGSSSSSGSGSSAAAAGVGFWSDARGGDQLRRLLEGCDGPQGAHLLVDLAGPWLGYGLGAAEEWSDEVGGGGLTCLALHRPRDKGKKAGEEGWRLVEAALGVHRLLEAGALLLPLGVGVDAGKDGDGEQRARQAVGLAAASGVYCRGGGQHMREWIHGVRSGSQSGVATLELAFPFPPAPLAAGAAAVSALLQPPADPRAAASRERGDTAPRSGLLSHVVPLTPTPAAAPQQPLRRLSGLVSLYCGGMRGGGLGVVNAAAKYYPWFQPQLNYAEPRPFPVRRWPFPVAWCVRARACVRWSVLMYVCTCDTWGEDGRRHSPAHSPHTHPPTHTHPHPGTPPPRRRPRRPLAWVPSPSSGAPPPPCPSSTSSLPPCAGAGPGPPRGCGRSWGC